VQGPMTRKLLPRSGCYDHALVSFRGCHVRLGRWTHKLVLVNFGLGSFLLCPLLLEAPDACLGRSLLRCKGNRPSGLTVLRVCWGTEHLANTFLFRDSA
jgi:hypothetical protein